MSDPYNRIPVRRPVRHSSTTVRSKTTSTFVPGRSSTSRPLATIDEITAAAPTAAMPTPDPVLPPAIAPTTAAPNTLLNGIGGMTPASHWPFDAPSDALSDEIEAVL